MTTRDRSNNPVGASRFLNADFAGALTSHRPRK